MPTAALEERLSSPNSRLHLSPRYRRPAEVEDGEARVCPLAVALRGGRFIGLARGGRARVFNAVRPALSRNPGHLDVRSAERCWMDPEELLDGRVERGLEDQ